jgi:YD repeat-containing protein
MILETVPVPVFAQYHYDGSEVAVEYRPSSETWTYYLGLGIDLPVMRVDGSGNKQWYYRDAQGNISAVTDNSGNVLEAYEYTAQGHFQITNGSGTVLTGTGIGNDITYTGRSYDPETGNFFYRARYYSLDVPIEVRPLADLGPFERVTSDEPAKLRQVVPRSVIRD